MVHKKDHPAGHGAAPSKQKLSAYIKKQKNRQGDCAPISHVTLWDGDDIWFLNHPSRSFRLRRLMPNEVRSKWRRGTTHIVIKRQNGRFKKWPIGDDNGGKDWDAMPNTDSIGLALWNALETSEEFSLAEIRELAILLGQCDVAFRITP